MIKIEHVVFPSDGQMMFVIEGMRNAFNSWDKSDSKMCSCADTGVEIGFHLGEVDEALMCKLARLGSDERKFMRQMPIMMRITAPLYWWKEFDTYKVGTVSNSCSTMHTIANREFQWEDFSIEYLRYERFGTIEDAQNKMRDDAITQFENTRNTLNAYRHQYLKAKEKGKEDLAKDYWRQIFTRLVAPTSLGNGGIYAMLSASCLTSMLSRLLWDLLLAIITRYLMRKLKTNFWRYLL